MKTQLLPCPAAPVSTACGFFTALCLFASYCYASELEIATWKSGYVLGEPVVLTVFVKNATREPLRVWPDAIRHQMIAIELSEDGKHFRPIEISGRIINVGTASVTLLPGEKKGYVFRILVSEKWFNNSPKEKKAGAEEAGRFLFLKRPGRYFVRARMRSRPSVVTARLSVRVEPPCGESAVVWSKIREPAMLYFLQFGRPLRSDWRTVKRAVEVLREHEEHAYYDDLVWALRAYYHNQVLHQGARQFPERESIRKLLALPLMENFFSATGGRIGYDRRLRLRQVILEAGSFTLDELLQKATRQTGVVLSRERSITGDSRIDYPGGVLSLRQFMRQLSEVGNGWVRHGDGYRLVVVPAR